MTNLARRPTLHQWDRRISIALTTAALGLMSACASVQPSPSAAPPPECPTTVEEAGARSFPTGFDNIGEDTFVGAGYVIRFVPAPDPDFRGYDINVTRWFYGRPSNPGIFLLSDKEITGVDAGDPVLFIVERTDNEFAYVPSACPPIQPIADEDARGN